MVILDRGMGLLFVKNKVGIHGYISPSSPAYFKSHSLGGPEEGGGTPELDDPDPEP